MGGGRGKRGAAGGAPFPPRAAEERSEQGRLGQEGEDVLVRGDVAAVVGGRPVETLVEAGHGGGGGGPGAPLCEEGGGEDPCQGGGGEAGAQGGEEGAGGGRPLASLASLAPRCSLLVRGEEEPDQNQVAQEEGGGDVGRGRRGGPFVEEGAEDGTDDPGELGAGGLAADGGGAVLRGGVPGQEGGGRRHGLLDQAHHDPAGADAGGGVARASRRGADNEIGRRAASEAEEEGAPPAQESRVHEGARRDAAQDLGGRKKGGDHLPERGGDGGQLVVILEEGEDQGHREHVHEHEEVEDIGDRRTAEGRKAEGGHGGI
mmetsp:Transcript_9212/g.20343  ORF Transcript_9212/g.20343 Transcript_9212/m.20343 type:complete len:317 (-) Transcript_9212:20-970(-)